ncbi:MAG TPA: YggS family pyridoxal phosphate-dependent enzyme [Acidimicrobiia bacterium]|nr:YggS family pyridoxal phosphate-dependent enzyme [Acidimicrobiia bacterium]
MSLESVMRRVAKACDRSGRRPDDVRLVVVSKGQTIDAIRDLYDRGHRDFGENRADELAEKVSLLPDDIRWHFVGHLQSNKARVVRPAAAYLHSLDRLSLAKAWLKGAGTPPPTFLQVNIGGEAQKFGVDPDQAADMASTFSALDIPLVGVMAIIPIVTEPNEARVHFRHLAEVGRRVASEVPSATGLSMGMTDDFEVAVEEGATVIRVGRAIFGDDHSTAP